nr:MAG TPA: OAR domain protein [Caudoviricetes sp.]
MQFAGNSSIAVLRFRSRSLVTLYIVLGLLNLF